MRLRKLILTLSVGVILLTSCAAPSVAPAPEQATPTPTPTPAPTPTPTPTPTPEPTPAPTPPLAIIPQEILASHFGIDGVVQDMDGISKLGIRWERSPIPFVWGTVEPQKGEYVWQEVDGCVHRRQDYNFAILPIIWPFAEWDQANWGPAPTDTGPMIDEKFLGRSRRKPYDMDAYRRFVSALVERYDGDGIGDMPGLRYPIKYWEVMNEPSLQTGYYTTFRGSSEDYLEVLKATYQAVKKADPEAKVLHAGMAGEEPPMVSLLSFWEPIFEKGSQYFDITNIHTVGTRAELIIPEFKKFLSKHGIDKPIWVTEAEYFVTRYASPEEHGQAFVKSYVVSFACGVDKFFYTSFTALFFVLKHQATQYIKDSCLIDESGEKRLAYYGLKTLIEKLDKFTSAEKLAEGQYRFMVEGKAIYVLWGSGEIPEEITGEVLVTDIYGEETRTNSSAISLTESPIFVEQYSH